MTTPAGTSRRRVALTLHPRRPDAVDVAVEFINGVCRAGIQCLVPTERLDELRERVPGADLVGFQDADSAVEGHRAELLVVFGGDGTILRAAEWALPREVPLLGVNLGHVGFLAELEPSDTSQLVTQVVDGHYEIERRLVLRVEVTDSLTGVTWETFAINEVSIEKASRERMLEVKASVDGRPVQRWSCDGVLVSTPTGSTAYAFSAGGPVMWPDVEAILLVPLSAHALFNRPLALSPGSRVDFDLSGAPANAGVVWCDGARTTDVRPTSHVAVRRHARDLLIARLREQPFTTRLVKKFDLPVEGWRYREQGA